MNWVPATLGILLGFGILLAWQGFRVVTDKTQPETARRTALWKLNGGIALAAASMVGITLVAPG